MTSTLLSYQLFARNMPQSLRQVAAEPTNKSDKAYYDAHIGKVKTVDDFVNNFRLFSYAMKAYGMEDLTYAKGLIKKVLSSDLSDSHSVANQLADPRYRAFAQAFDFTTTGAIKATAIQSAAQQSATVAAFKANVTGLDATTVTSATSYYTAHIGAVTSFADLEKDQKLYSFVMTAYGVDPGTSHASVEKAVEGDLSDPNGGLNTTPGAGYLAMKLAFNADASGAATAGALVAQTTDQTTGTVQAYALSVGSDTVSRNAAKSETAYYSSKIGDITDVSQITTDPRLTAFVVKAYNLPASTSPTMLSEILTSDPSDPKSLVSTAGDPGYKAAAQAFNFGSTGALKAVAQLQNAGQQQSTVALYTARSSTDTAADDAATTYYKAHIGTVTSVSALQHDSQLYGYVLKAYGVDPTTPAATVTKVLEQTASASGSVVSTTTDSSDLALHQAFTVDSAGKAADVLQAQSTESVSATTAAYATTVGTGATAQATAKVETSYYKAAITKVHTVGEFLADPRLVTYALKAYGLPASTSTDKLRQVLTSDTTSPASVASRLGGASLALAQAFNFTVGGVIAHQLVQTAQDGTQRRTTNASFNEQALEDEAGQQNEGVKLALYFQRKAPTIADAYSILADKALTQVFQTYLGLPASTSATNLDQQAAYIKSKINFADLKNPAKLAKMVLSFAARYDIANPDTTQQNTIGMLFGGSSDSSGTS